MKTVRESVTRRSAALSGDSKPAFRSLPIANTVIPFCRQYSTLFQEMQTGAHHDNRTAYFTTRLHNIAARWALLSRSKQIE